MESINYITFFAGIVSFLSPCIVPMITVYFSLITGMSMEQLTNTKENAKIKLHILINTIIFIAAFTIVFTLAGGTAGQIAKFMTNNMKVFNMIGGVMVILLALKLLGLLDYSLKNRYIQKILDKRKISTPFRYLTTFLIGLFFAIACSHCIGPILYSMLIFAGSTGSAYSGMYIMFLFSMGLAIPYLIVGLTLNKSLKLIRKIMKYQKIISYIVGSILLVFGIMMLFNKFSIIVEWLYKFSFYKIPIGM